MAAVSGDEYWNTRYHAFGGVRTTLVQGRDVYVGGSFIEIGGVAATNIARWNGASWSAVGHGLDGTVLSLAAHGNSIYAGGYFTFAGDISLANVARWDGTNWSQVGAPAFPYTTIALGVSTNGAEIYAGHQNLGTGGGRYIFKFDGNEWAPLGGGLDASDALSTPVGAITVTGNDVYVGGQFESIGGVAATNLARWNGTKWWPVGGGVDWSQEGGGTTLKVAALAFADGKLYVGGNLKTAGSTKINNIARWDGTNWFNFAGGVPFVVRALVVNGTEVFAAGGGFNSLPAIAKWDGAAWTALGSGINVAQNEYGTVYALGLRGADVFVGGIFSMAGGQLADNFAIWQIPQPLEAVRVNGRLHISWSTQAVDYLLETATMLPASSWSPVSQIPQIINSRYTVTNNLMGGRRFFRLSHP